MSSRPPPKRPTLALDVNVVQDNMPQEVVPRVFIGSIHASFNQDALMSLKITHVREEIVDVDVVLFVPADCFCVLFPFSPDYQCISTTSNVSQVVHLFVGRFTRQVSQPFFLYA